MRRLVFISCFSLFVVIVGIGVSSVSEAQNEASRSYIVQYGDTLWDIAGAQLNNPFRWRDIHQNNPHIVNPNLIYPGDILNVGPRQAGIPDSGTQAGPGARLSDKAIARPWYGLPVPTPEEIKRPKVPLAVVPSPDFIEANGYIVPYTMKQLEAEDFAQITGVQVGEGETTARLIRSEYTQAGLVFGDIIYINKGTENNIREGDTFLAFRPLREIRHPFTSEVLGTQVAILGRLRIKTQEAGISSARIVKSYNYMEIGNPIMAVSELSLPLTKPLVGNSQSYGFKVGNQLVGHIIADRDNRQQLSFGDIVFLDVGAAQGVQPADNFIVYREIGEGFPKESIGRVTVLGARKNTSTALVTESSKPIEIGEKVVLMK